MNTGTLRAKIEAVNMVHEFADSFYDAMQPLVSQFLGKKIIKSDGTLMKKLADCLPITNDPKIRSWRISSDYSLAWVIRSSITLEDGRADYECSVYLGNLKSGILSDLYPKPDIYKFDFTYDEVLKTIEDAKQAKKISEQLQKKASPFESLI